MSETREDRDVRLTRERVLNRGAGGDAMTRLEPVDVERFEAALEARTKARLAAATTPLTMTVDQETGIKGRLDKPWALPGHEDARALIVEGVALRAALGEARERAERLGTERDAAVAMSGGRHDAINRLIDERDNARVKLAALATFVDGAHDSDCWPSNRATPVAQRLRFCAVCAALEAARGA